MVDFQKLNKKMIDYRYPVPDVAKILNKLRQYFSTIDLARGFPQIEMCRGYPKKRHWMSRMDIATMSECLSD